MKEDKIKTRQIKLSDAAAFLELRNTIDGESDFMIMNRGERKSDAKKSKKLIESYLHTKNQIIFVAEDGKKLVGFIMAFGQEIKRLQHTARLVIGIRKKYWGKGIGSQLFEAMHTWAKENKIHRLDLEVNTDNVRGIALYKKFGYKIEGTRKDAIYHKKKYKDLHVMGKIFK